MTKKNMEKIRFNVVIETTVDHRMKVGSMLQNMLEIAAPEDGDVYARVVEARAEVEYENGERVEAGRLENNIREEIENIIHFDREKMEQLEVSYNEAIKAEMDVFLFEGNEYLTSYAKYLLEHLHNRFDK